MKSEFSDRKLQFSRLSRRTAVVYIAATFILAIIVLSGYFFIKKPEHATSNLPEEPKKVILFKDVKYSGERKGVVDWEIRARLVRQYLDKGQVVEMEGIEGEYKPQGGATVSFKGLKGEMDREKEIGSVQDVEVYYKGEYVVRSSSVDFDFKQSLAHTEAPVELKGKRLAMIGVGLNADTKEQVISVERDVSGTMQSEKQKIRFSADRFVYQMKESRYLLSGKVVVKGEQINLLCDRVSILSDGETIEKADATGHVQILVKGAIAKSERAVYYLKEDKVVLEQEPYVVRDGVEMRGQTVTYNLKTDKFFVEKPKMRIERRAR
jgi:lipopolysaccharide transport protein LptA/LPS export ABC transporter protein LptC